MPHNIKKILIKKNVLERKIRSLADRISRDYRKKNLVLVCVLKGAVVFLSELIKNLSIQFTLDFIQVGSYGKKKIPGKITLKKDIEENVKNKHVLIIEDIIDTGRTLAYIFKLIKKKRPKSIRICSLLDKPSRHEVKVTADYLGFNVPNRFIVGYGIDYNEKFRNLPYIAAVD